MFFTDKTVTMTWDFSIYFVEEIKSLTNGNENQGVFHTMGSTTVLLFGRQNEPGRHDPCSYTYMLHALVSLNKMSPEKGEHK